MAAIRALKAQGVADPIVVFRRGLRETIARSDCSQAECEDAIMTLALLEGVDALAKRDPTLWR